MLESFLSARSSASRVASLRQSRPRSYGEPLKQSPRSNGRKHSQPLRAPLTTMARNARVSSQIFPTEDASTADCACETYVMPHECTPPGGGDDRSVCAIPNTGNHSGQPVWGAFARTTHSRVFLSLSLSRSFRMCLDSRACRDRGLK